MLHSVMRVASFRITHLVWGLMAPFIISNKVIPILLIDEMNFCGCFGRNLESELRESTMELDRLRKSVDQYEELLLAGLKPGRRCRAVPMKETKLLIHSVDEDRNKMLNEYVRERTISYGKYGKVALYRSSVDGKQYAIKHFLTSQLLKLRVGPSETAMSDVLREISIMKTLDHPNIVSLIEVIDDPNTNNFYMVFEYVEGKLVADGSGPSSGSGETTIRKYLRDIIAGLMYLHDHNIVHRDIKPDNLLVTSSGVVKIRDFRVSQFFEDNNDELRWSYETLAFAAPECCTGQNYHGKPADTWALGVTLYRMVIGKYPFHADTDTDTMPATVYKILNEPTPLPSGLNPDLRNLLEGILCKDPNNRLTLKAVAEHRWVVGKEGPIHPVPYWCWCKRNFLKDLGRLSTEENSRSHAIE